MLKDYSKTAHKPNLGNVAVIGGCGFLGHHVVNLLIECYHTYSITVIDLHTTRNRRPELDGVLYIDVDITDTEHLTSVMRTTRPDVVIHTASPPAQADISVSRSLFENVNVNGTRSVIEASQKAGAKAIVYTSSASVVSDNKSDLIHVDERWPVLRGSQQMEYYARTKAEAEDLVLAANRQEPYDLLTAAIRPSGIIGEGDTMVTHQMMKIYQEGKHNVQLGENENLFDFTYVVNVAHGHLLAANALLHASDSDSMPVDKRVDGEAFFITNDSPVYFWDFARAVWKAAGNSSGLENIWVLPCTVGLMLGFLSEIYFMMIRRPPTFNRQRIIFSCMTRYFDISKAKDRLGYQPLVSLEEGIKRSVKWSLDKEKRD